jgi:hypothetical protein
MAVDLKSVAADIEAYRRQHPEYKAWVEAGEKLSIRLTEEATLILIGQIPGIGPVLEAAVKPVLDAVETRAEDAAVDATDKAL